MKKTCASCQYFRESRWCSNSKSEHFRFASADPQFVQASDSCAVFVKRYKKAPILLRMKIKVVNFLRRLR